VQVTFPLEADDPLYLLVARALVALGSRLEIAIALLLLSWSNRHFWTPVSSPVRRHCRTA